MSRRPSRLIAPTFTLAFIIIALVFSSLTVSSKKWVVRDHYRNNFPQNWTDPFYTIYRSPFQICRPTDFTLSDSTTDTTPAPNVTCTYYKPFGRNATSCELESITQSDAVDTLGDKRLCQQIHLAGNFGIASTCFVGLGLLTSIALLLSSFIWGTRDKHESRPEGGHRRHIRFTQYASLTLQVFLFVGFATGIISQFYGILGFVQSLPNQADFASSSGNRDEFANHGPWYQGVALSTYATCAWAFSAAAGVLASRIWRTPTWSVAS